MNCKKVTDYLHSSKQGFIIARDLKAGGPKAVILFYAQYGGILSHTKWLNNHL